MSTSDRPWVLATSVLFVLVLASCKGEDGGDCPPTDPLCVPPAVQTISVTSPVDSVMAVGRTVQMTASATDQSGNPISATFTWSSTNTSVATVNSGSGLVSADAAGTTTIEASASGETGSVQMRAVDADLAAIQAALTDALRTALADALTGTPASSLSNALSDCSDAITDGHVLDLDQCLTDALGVSSTNTNDQALLGVLSLFFTYSQLQLNL